MTDIPHPPSRPHAERASALRLRVEDLAIARGGRRVLAGLGFTLASGEALAVTGRNGAGKSSLLRIIAGLLVPAAGTLALDGGDDELTVAEQAHYLGHRDALKPALTVAENLTFWRDFLGGGAAAVDVPAAGAVGKAKTVWLLDEAAAAKL
jgi:heme exporter protein A